MNYSEEKYPDVVTDVTELGAVQSAVEAFNERIEKEILGAWRAGYDYLHLHYDTSVNEGFMFTYDYTAVPTSNPDPLMDPYLSSGYRVFELDDGAIWQYVND